MPANGAKIVIGHLLGALSVILWSTFLIFSQNIQKWRWYKSLKYVLNPVKLGSHIPKPSTNKVLSIMEAFKENFFPIVLRSQPIVDYTFLVDIQ